VGQLICGQFRATLEVVDLLLCQAAWLLELVELLALGAGIEGACADVGLAVESLSGELALAGLVGDVPLLAVDNGVGAGHLLLQG